jgi:hypothetical protein
VGIGLGAASAGIGWLVKLLKSAPAPNGTGNGGADWRTHITTAVSALTAAVATIGEQTGDVRDTVLKMDARLQIMPTREELAAIAEKNRHSYRNELAAVTLALNSLESRIAARKGP